MTETSRLPGLDEVASIAHAELSAKHRAREEGLRISRAVIRLSANAIRAVHRLDFDTARQLLQEAKDQLADTAPILENNPEIYFAGFLSDARKEYTEGNVTLALISGAPLPYPAELGVDVAPYLNGMAESIGELRRFILDRLRKDDAADCERFLEVMDEIYNLLVTMDFPEGVTAGLRHSTDAMRGVLERTRGDLTMAMRQRHLEAQLTAWQQAQGHAESSSQ